MPTEFLNANPDHDGILFRSPTDLQRQELKISRALLIGQCTVDHIRLFLIEAGIECDFVHIQSMLDPSFTPPHPIESYDLQIIIIPFDRITPYETYFGLGYGDVEGERQRFERSDHEAHHLLDQCLRWHREHNILTFVGNFLVPQQNPMGKMLPRYDLRNPVYFAEKLNESLSTRVDAMDNAYILDIDGLANTFGKKYILDDSVWSLAHGGFITTVEYENFESQRDGVQKRLEELGPVSAYYTTRTHEAYQALRHEILSLYRSVRQADAVKLVVIDLDDTAWRGMAAESDNSHEFMTLGWPIGFIEALMFLKRRGVLLAIISKNEPDVAERMWNFAYGNIFPMSNFVQAQINWQPKHENMQEILKATNLLPQNTVYIDDNPAEREIIQAAFPDLRVIGDNPYYTRRILLWAAETQAPFISKESMSRTESIQGVIARENDRTQMSHEEFLASLNIHITVKEVDSLQDKSFGRAFELINKTNQFNTTGKRWTIEEFSRGFEDGLRVLTLDVSDRFTQYGIVCVAVLDGTNITQVVMSCRVIGLGVEQAMLAVILDTLKHRGATQVTASAQETEKNVLSRDLFKRHGFEQADANWWHHDMSNVPEKPTHIAIAHASASQIGN